MPHHGVTLYRTRTFVYRARRAGGSAAAQLGGRPEVGGVAAPPPGDAGAEGSVGHAVRGAGAAAGGVAVVAVVPYK